MRHLFIVSSLMFTLVACSQSDEAPANTIYSPQSATTSIETELIPRDALFGDPERTEVQISPDGKTLSWLAPLHGVMNVWVAPADDTRKAKAITSDATRGIRQYVWSYRPNTILYFRDNGGDENFHLFSIDVITGINRDLSPFPKTRAELIAVSHLHQESILVAMNDRDAQWHDLYRVDLARGLRTLVKKNTNKVYSYFVDANYAVRMAQMTRPDGGSDLLAPDGRGAMGKD